MSYKLGLLLGAFGLFFLYAFHLPLLAQARPAVPLSFHCKKGSPLPLDDPNFCGCTWGAVYYRGQPVTGASVTLQFGTQVTQTVSAQSKDFASPFYDMSGAGLGAKKGDVMTVTTTFAGQTIVRAFRALPDNEKEQEVSLVIPTRGEWTPWLTGGYTLTLTTIGNTLWAGGPAGLLAIDLTTQQQVSQSLPWATPTVVSVVGAPNHHLWAAGPHNLAEFDGNTWQNRTPPFAATIRTLAVQPTTGAVWVGGGDSAGALAVYDGVWHPVSAVNELITTLTFDSAGDLWAGTWGGGVYRHPQAGSDPNSGWLHYRIGDGMASNNIYASASNAEAVWFGTQAYLDPQGVHGGISRYRLTDGSWRTYTTAQGLPADVTQAPAAIYALAAGPDSSVWAGTPKGIFLLATPDVWITDTVTSGSVRTLATNGDKVIAAQTNGQLWQLDRTRQPDHAPTAQITSAAGLTATPLNPVTLTANASETGHTILAWDWRSDRDGPLCTTAATCLLPVNRLSPGLHTVSLRVQNDAGVWSAPVTTQVTVSQVAMSYLPFVQH
ncbi:MAG: hypothetical protein U0350_22990 [Caldilineaceae bacterium]